MMMVPKWQRPQPQQNPVHSINIDLQIIKQNLAAYPAPVLRASATNCDQISPRGATNSCIDGFCDTGAGSSKCLREQGNGIFKIALTLAPILRRARLLSAKDVYIKACAAARNAEDRASSQGNVAAVFRRLLEIESESSQINAYTQSLLHHSSLSIKYGSEPGGKSTEWLLVKRIEIVQLTYAHCLRRDDEEEFASYIGRLHHATFSDSSAVLVPEARLILLHAIFKQHFLQAVRLIESSDHLGAIQQLEDSRRASIEAETLCRQHPPRLSQVITAAIEKKFESAEAVEQFAEIENDLAVLREDCLLQMNVARSGQMIIVGNELLRNAVFGSASFSTYAVQDAIDCFRQAIVHARGVDIEHEAWANSRLGYTFSQVLKQPATGHLRYKACIQLALSLYPRKSDTKPWFITANRAVEEYQKVVNSRDQAETEKLRAPILLELSSELALLKAASSKGAKHLLSHVYATMGSDGSGRDTDVSISKQLLKAIVLFHPDKCEQNDLKKKTLNEEVVKMLNHHYTLAKDQSD